MSVFKLHEIMDMGIEKEKKRRDFYGKVKNLLEVPKLKEVFGKLEEWEKEHVNRFSEIKNELEEEQVSKQSYQGELANYIDAYLDNKLYSDIEIDDFYARITTPEEAISIAMSFEKDAIIFFTELLEMVDDSQKDTVKKLINEEKQHLVYLYNLKKELQ